MAQNTVFAEQPNLYQRVEMVLKYGHSQQIRDAAERIDELSDSEQKQLMPVLEELLKLDDVLVQQKIIQQIAKLSYNDLDTKIIDFLDSDYESVFYTAINTIEKKNIQSAKPKLQEKLKQAEYQEEDSKLLALIRLAGSLKDDSLIDFFLDKMKDEKNHYTVRREIFRYMGDVASQRSDIMAYLSEIALDDNQPITLRAHAVYALSKSSLPTVSENFKVILKQIDSIEDNREKRKYANLRSQLISALARKGDKEIMQVLIKMSKDDDATVRLKAIRELGKLKTSQVIDLIRYKSKYDPDLGIQEEARKILKTFELATE